eukprot:TRINITY_DN170_c1_g2_i1.p1 TRINITY_DN170_c1_g2~~TRINITY_DN170_c1_g2_i1.p1  ORF type:complete len:545 (+),score=177.86 TRINITY_DN170_c1_g2_i1:137-1771(+)
MYPGDIEVQKVEEDVKKSKSSLAVPLLGEVKYEDVEDQFSKKKSWTKKKLDKAYRYLREHRSKVVIGLIYAFINVGLFIFWAVFNGVAGANMFVVIAKGFGMMLNFNCALILLPVCRNIITALRATALNRWVPFDSNIMFHRRIAWVICYSAFGHGIAHYFNYNLAGLTGQGNPYLLAWFTLAGVTGNLIVFVMVIMYTTAIDSIRRRYFNLFYFTHHLFIAFFILVFIHAYKRFWIFFTIPAVTYIVERLVREYRAKQRTTVNEVINHPSDVVELRFYKKKFKYKSGQYLFLNCPYLSYYEWHPFTISSAPHEEFISCHIRCVGKWTKGLRDFIAPDNIGESAEINEYKGSDGKPLLRMDGPFGAASEDIFDYKVVMLIGAGIGVTPFASALKELYYRKKNDAHCKVEKAYFFWICRDYAAFEWFQEVIRTLEIEMKEQGDDFLSINIYLTQRFKPERIDELKLEQEESEFDPLTNLESKTNFGRPDFDVIFDDLREAHIGTKIGLFFCGPRILAKMLRGFCMTKSPKSKKSGAKFIFHKENF